ncbi:uncharacterized protein J3D65DRAFT_662265 [Phyllosticta citribraziliensis]|uniref:Uncharacterized protein n=1 Tax=Phyllosticta citribraziliensis TaxID=989973 RepID=A0ABR1L694_9PEZI
MCAGEAEVRPRIYSLCRAAGDGGCGRYLPYEMIRAHNKGSSIPPAAHRLGVRDRHIARLGLPDQGSTTKTTSAPAHSEDMVDPDASKKSARAEILVKAQLMSSHSRILGKRQKISRSSTWTMPTCITAVDVTIGQTPDESDKQLHVRIADTAALLDGFAKLRRFLVVWKMMRVQNPASRCCLLCLRQVSLHRRRLFAAIATCTLFDAMAKLSLKREPQIPSPPEID